MKKLLVKLLSLALTVGMLAVSVPAAATDNGGEAPTGYCIEDTIEVGMLSNYCDAEDFFTAKRNESFDYVFRAPEDVTIVDLTLRLLCDGGAGDWGSQLQELNFASGNVIHAQTDPGIITVSFNDEQDPCTLRQNDGFLYLTLCPTENDLWVTLEVEDMTVRTPEGDVTVYRNGYRIYHAGDGPAAVSCASNYAVPGESQALTVGDCGWFTFQAPEEVYLTKLKFKLTSVHNETGSTVMLSLRDIETFSDDVHCSYAGGVSDITGTFETKMPYHFPCRIKKGDTLFRVKAAPLDAGSFTLKLEIIDMTIRTPLGDVMTYAIGKRYALQGDSDGNGVIDIKDATHLQKHLAEFKNSKGKPLINETNAKQMYLSDVDGNGEITIRDVTRVQEYLAEYIDSFA